MSKYLTEGARLRWFRLLTCVGTCLATMPTGSLAASSALHAKSEVAGFSLVTLGALPRSPENGSLDEYCEGYREKKLTAAGKKVAGLGWIVTSEAPLGRYQVVTFASGFTPGTSAMCFVRNSNIAIFDGTNLVALAYGSRAAEIPLGIVEPQESGALLVWTDPPGWAIAELRQDSDGFRLTAVAPVRTFCNRRAVVPNVYGKPISVARRVLIEHGWHPLRPHERPGEADMANELAEHGIIEAETCSGTGAAYCSFNYRGTSGLLSVTTAGEDPTVRSYTVKCDTH